MKKTFKSSLFSVLFTFFVSLSIILPQNAFAVQSNFVNGDFTVTGSLHVKGGLDSNITIVNSSYTILPTDYFILHATTASAYTDTLPTAVGKCGKIYFIKDGSGAASTHNITLTTVLGQTIDGAGSKAIAANYGWYQVASNCTNWNTVASNYLAAGSGDVTAAGINAFLGANTHAGIETHAGAEVFSAAVSFTGNPIFTVGTPNFANGATWTGTFPGTHTVSGTVTNSGAQTFTGLTKIKSPTITSSLTAINTTGAVTAAQLVVGGISSTTAATVTATLPTATLLATQLGSVGAGAVFDFSVYNSGSNTLTVALNTGITNNAAVITGGDTLTVSTAQAVGLFRLFFTSTTSAILYRIG